MKVALLTDGIYPYAIGGMQRHSYFLAKYLAQNNVFVRVYHCVFENREIDIHNYFTADELKNIEFIEINFNNKIKIPGYYILESYLYSKRIDNHLIKDIRSFDFIYSKGFTAWVLLKNKKNIKNYPKVGIKLHGYEMYQYANNISMRIKHWLLQIPARFVTKNADYVFSYGGKVSDILKTKLHVPINRIVEIPTAIEGELLAKSITAYHQPLKFVFVGRYEERKGIKELQQAILNLNKENKLFEIIFIGDIPDTLRLKDKNIQYLGKITNYDKIKEILIGCDVLICPSFSEGMPNVIVEAMANGLTVLATDVGAISLLVNKETGFLIQNNLVQTIEMEIKKILGLSKEEIQKKKGQALHHITKNFTWEVIIKDVISKIENFRKL